jgi:L-seryl-tRNA(Ser) seleniumtransferase
MPDTPDISSLRGLPSVSRLLAHPALVEALGRHPRALLVDSLRNVLDEARARGAVHVDDWFAARAIERAEQSARPSLRRAINATGVVLHTGLGRAVLAEEAQRAVAEVASGHSPLEIDPETGRRGSRQTHVEDLLRELTGAEAALVVNNNAGATVLCVTALTAGREVLLSRGELVEIGGSFRMPDIIEASGARLVEVGTTNRTRLGDFERAVTPETGLIQRCHPSNYRVVGFTEAVPAEELAALARRSGIPMLDDLGSGAIVDTGALGAGPTTTLRAAVSAGADVICASGDKLLGGPQAGIILGKAEAVRRIAKHPLARALRVDKLTLAALEATLRLYRDPEHARTAIPTLRYLSRTIQELQEMAEDLRGRISAAVGPGLEVTTLPSESQVGGGSLPGENLPTVCVSVRSATLSPDALAGALRLNDPSVFARVQNDSVLLDPRTLDAAEVEEIVAAFTQLATA